jgi:tetratricopeptide (TPR) repeat protein
MKSWLSAFAATAAILSAEPASAAPGTPASAPAVDKATLAQDDAVVGAALQAVKSGGYPALAAHVDKLEAVYARTPRGAAPGSDAAAVYGVAAWTLMAWNNEQRRYEEAVDYGRRAIALMPDWARCATELAFTYNQLGRPAESLPVLDRWWSAYAAEASPADKAKVLRLRGHTLIALKRLDEAETAFRDSLKLAPGVESATVGLDTIARMRAEAK